MPTVTTLRPSWRASSSSASIGSFTAGIPSDRSIVLRLIILEPTEHQSRSLNGRLYCTPKALWKLRWFLRDFGYDPDLMGRDEIDEKALMGLRGIVRISRTTLNGRSFLNLGGFAPSNEWEELSVSVTTNQEVARDV